MASKRIPEKLIEIRRRSGLTRAQIAEKVGAKSSAEIEAYENDEDELLVTVLCGYANLAGCSIDSLASDDLEVYSANNITLTEFLRIIKKWETEGKIRAHLESFLPAPFQASFPTCTVSIEGDVLNLRSGDSDLSLRLVPTMQFRYSDSEGSEPHPLLEVKALVWRCFLSYRRI